MRSCGCRRSRRHDHTRCGGGGLSGRRVRAISKRLLQQFRRDRRTLAVVFVAPVVILSLLGYLLRGGGSGPKVDLVVEDNGALAIAVADHLAADSGITVSRTWLAAARSDLDTDAIAGYVRLPAGFSANSLPRSIVAPVEAGQGDEPGPATAVIAAVERGRARA